VSKENKTILVTAGKSKTRSRRLIPITKNLWAWLAQEKNRTGLLIPPGWREKWLEIRKAAGFGANKPWPRNGCRHSFASYRLAIDSDVNKCAEEMGNSAEIIFRHYRGLIKDSSDAIAYWKLTPASLDSMARSFKK
jgi:integrase